MGFIVTGSMTGCEERSAIAAGPSKSQSSVLRDAAHVLQDRHARLDDHAKAELLV